MDTGGLSQIHRALLSLEGRAHQGLWAAAENQRRVGFPPVLNMQSLPCPLPMPHSAFPVTLRLQAQDGMSRCSTWTWSPNHWKAWMPGVDRMTKSPSKNCKPRPQKTALQDTWGQKAEQELKCFQGLQASLSCFQLLVTNTTHCPGVKIVGRPIKCYRNQQTWVGDRARNELVRLWDTTCQGYKHKDLMMIGSTDLLD